MRVFVIVLALCTAARADIYEAELHRVSEAADLEVTVDSSLDRHAFAINTVNTTFLVRGGSQYACDVACARLLREQGFRYWSPQLDHVPIALRPVTLDGEIVWRSRLFLQYGHWRIQPLAEEGNKLKNDYEAWAKKVGVWENRAPTGHSWGSIRDRLEARGELPDELFVGDTDQLNIYHPEAVSAVVADRVRLLLSLRANEPDAGHYMVSIEAADGQDIGPDGVPYTPEQYFTWANEVSKGVREAIPDAWCSSYAYSNHRIPPPEPFKLKPNLHVEVTTAFSTGGYESYEELIAAWIERAHSAEQIGLREFPSVHEWTWGYPGAARACSGVTWRETLPKRHSNGQRVWNGQTNGNWMVQLYGTQCLVEWLLTGTCDEDRILTELTDQVFDSSPEARELYEYWATMPATNAFMWHQSYELLDQIPTSDLLPSTRDLRDAVMMAYDHWQWTQRGSVLGDDEYIELMEKSANIMESDAYHSYAEQRRLANGLIKKDFPELWMFALPPPQWLKGENGFSDEEFRKELVDLRSQTQIPEYSETLELFHTGESFAAAPYLQSRHPVELHIVGPVTLHLDDAVVSFGPGQHAHPIAGKTKVEYCRGQGSAAIRIHPEDGVFMEQIQGGNAWIWAETSTLRADGNPRFTLLTPKRYDCTIHTRKPGMPYTEIVDAQPGVVVVSGPNLRGVVSVWSDPPYLQLRRDVFVMPEKQ